MRSMNAHQASTNGQKLRAAIVLNLRRGRSASAKTKPEIALDPRGFCAHFSDGFDPPAILESVEDFFRRYRKRHFAPLCIIVAELYRFRHIRFHFPSKHYQACSVSAGHFS